ncbi:MAG: hypothetical protein ACXWEN_07940 [Actinomycetota bacterium]
MPSLRDAEPCVLFDQTDRLPECRVPMHAIAFDLALLGEGRLGGGNCLPGLDDPGADLRAVRVVTALVGRRA